MKEEEMVKLKHDYAMEELKYQRETIKIKHQLDLEKTRILMAEKKRHFLRIEQSKERSRGQKCY